MSGPLLFQPIAIRDAMGIDQKFTPVPSPEAYWLAKRAQSVKIVQPSTYMK